MTENRVQEMRKRAGLTQMQLAAAAGTSQQQIQRIESGTQRPSIHLAGQIAAALGQRTESLFSQERPTVSRSKSGEYLERKGGIEASDHMWDFHFSLRGGAQGSFKLCLSEKEMLHEAMWYPQSAFIVFDTNTHRVALNTVHLVSCQFEETASAVLETEGVGDMADGYLALLYLAGHEAVREIPIRPDTHDIEEDPSEGEYMAFNQMALRELDDTPKPGARIGIVGQREDEETFVLASEVALLSIPLECCDVALGRAVMEGANEKQSKIAA